MKKTKENRLFKTLDTLLTEELSNLENRIQCYLDTRNFGLKVEFSKLNHQTTSSWHLKIDFDDFEWSLVVGKPHWMFTHISLEIDENKSFVLTVGDFKNSFELHDEDYDYDKPSTYRVTDISPKNQEITNIDIEVVTSWIEEIFSQFKRAIDTIDINDMQVYKEIEQTIRIEEKLKKLKSMDREFTIFGSEKHQYQLNPVISRDELVAFEKRHHIELPLGYRNFLLEVGNGGVGPYYGLESLDEIEKNKKSVMDLKLPFPHTQKWNFNWDNVTEEEWETLIEDTEEGYYIQKWSTGLLEICDFGCGISLCLVVNGIEFGNMWVDDRGHLNGIYPDPYFNQKEDERTSFLDCYEMWLDQSLVELDSLLYNGK